MALQNGTPGRQSHRLDAIQQKYNRDHPMNIAVAGALSRVVSTTIMFPLDMVKTRLQWQGKLNGIRRYTGAYDAFTKIWQTEGTRGFFRGLAPRLIYSMPSAAISFFFYEQISKAAWQRIKPQEHKGELSSLVLPLLGMGCIRLIGSTFRTPFDVLKMRLQVQGTLEKMKYKNTLEAIRFIYVTEGLKSFFSFFHAALLRDIPFTSINYISYDLLKRVYPDHPLNRPLAGFGAGVVATALTIPLDVAKTRLQTQAILPPDQRRYSGVISALCTAVKEEGWRGLTRGLAPRLLYTPLNSTFIFTFYEMFRDVGQHFFRNQQQQ